VPARRLAPAVALVVGAATLAALHLARGLEYWNYSEGVYALSARLLLRGDDLYGHVVAAQPPWQFLLGAGVLAVDDGLAPLRLALGGLQLLAGLLGARAVWRLTGSAPAAVLAAPAALLTPWAVHEHGALTPELLAAPLLLGAALLATDPRRVPAAAVLAAAAPFVKWPFALAGLAVIALSAAPRRAAAWALAAVAVQAAAFTALFGSGLWEDSVVAQLGSGRRGAHVIAQVLVQAAWSLAGLLAAAAVALRLRRASRDPALLRVLTGVAAGLLATLVSVTKEGTGLTVLVPVEAVLVPLGLAGVVAAARAGARALAAAAAAALVFTVAQTASLLASSPTAAPFAYPTAARGAWGRVADEAGVRRQVAAAARCPAGVPYSGPPFYAFLARRPMPDGQPDQFLPAHSPALADVQARITAAARRCP
jgi:hypothetical protein